MNTLQEDIRNLYNIGKKLIDERSIYDNQINDLLLKIAITKFTVLEVGVGKQYPSIIAAYNTIRTKTLMERVIIKVSDGLYKENVINLGNHPFAHLIRIEGNVLNPEKCIIQWIPDSNGNSHGILMSGCNGINISGFTFVAECNDQNYTHRSIYVANRSHLFCDANSIIFSGGVRGFELYQSGLYMPGSRSSGLLDAAIVASQNSTVYVPDTIVDSLGMSESNKVPSRVGDYTLVPRGVWLSDNSFGFTKGSKFTKVKYGIIAERGSDAEFSSTNYDSCHIGLYGIFGATVQSFGQAKARNCEHGFVVDTGSAMHNENGIAEGCTIVGIRCSGASTFFGNKFTAINNAVGYQSLSGSTVHVPASDANSIGNTVKRDCDANSKLIWS